ncbi:MAG TPA: hypothetical protein VKA84_11820 [Gemmatimonadaceae bacterium]|nr:hypothetical protein [Gemmatimonadaceae bacterium]
MGRSEGDDRDLPGRDAEGREDEALEAAPPGVDEARHIQELVDGARHEWTGADGQRRHGGRGGAPAKGYGRGNRRPGDSGR